MRHLKLTEQHHPDTCVIHGPRDRRSGEAGMASAATGV